MIEAISILQNEIEIAPTPVKALPIMGDVLTDKRAKEEELRIKEKELKQAERERVSKENERRQREREKKKLNCPWSFIRNI